MILPGLSQGSVLLWVCLLLVLVLTAVSLTHKLLMSAASIESNGGIVGTCDGLQSHVGAFWASDGLFAGLNVI
jgi:hypothetical protein